MKKNNLPSENLKEKKIEKTEQRIFDLWIQLDIVEIFRDNEGYFDA